MAMRNPYQTKPKKRKFIILGKSLKITLLILNLVAATALFMSFLSAYVPPTSSMLICYCGLAFPYLLWTNLVFIVVWLPIDYRFSLLSLLMILLNINNIDRTFQLRSTEKPAVCANCVKVMSYNTKLFGLYQKPR